MGIPKVDMHIPQTGDSKLDLLFANLRAPNIGNAFALDQNVLMGQNCASQDIDDGNVSDR